MQLRIYVVRDSQLVEVVAFLYVEVAMNYKFLHIPYKCRIKQPDTQQHNGIINYETEMCMWKSFC